MPRIFDNIDTDLLPALRDTLQVSKRSDFCVGYFNLRGWKAIDGLVEQWAGGEGAQGRLLVGMQRLAHDELRLAYSLLPKEDQISQQTVIRLKQRLAEAFRAQLTFSDCRHVNKREVDAFPIDLEALAKSSRSKELRALAAALMQDLKENSVSRKMTFQHDTLTVQCIYPKVIKPIGDQIDCALAKHYHFTDEELDFILNYDIKYRLGRDTETEEE